MSSRTHDASDLREIFWTFRDSVLEEGLEQDFDTEIGSLVDEVGPSTDYEQQ